MAADVDDIVRNYHSLKAQREPWESTWQAIADTMLPAYNDIQSYRQPGDLRTQHILDTTGLQGNILLAGHLAGAVTNFQTRWFELRHGLAQLNERKEVVTWLDACSKTMQDKLSATTTPQSFHEKYLQLSGFGTGAIFSDESPVPGMDGSRSLLSRSLPIGTYCTAEDAAGMVDTLYREMQLSPRQAIQHFGSDGVHESVRQANEHAERRHSPSAYIHAVYPRSDRDPTREGQRDMAYASCYVDMQHKHLCSEGGYRWFPYMVSRWQKLASWSTWGFGPGHIALPEVLTLNRMDRDVLKALQMHILPPWWTDDPDSAGRVQLLPGFINPIAAGRVLHPMVAPGNFNISHLGMDERRQRIRQAFYMDQLITLPAADETGKMTAYEVAQRIAYMQRLMGPAFMRLLSEFLNPFIDITFGTMLEAGELPEPPDIVIIAAMQGHGKIVVDYEGPLARAQRADEITGYEGLLTMAERYFAATQDRSVYDNFSIDEIIQRSGKVWGVGVVLNDKLQRERLRQARQQAEQDAMEAEAMREDAKLLGPAASMVKALNPAPQEAAA